MEKLPPPVPVGPFKDLKSFLKYQEYRRTGKWKEIKGNSGLIGVTLKQVLVFIALIIAIMI